MESRCQKNGDAGEWQCEWWVCASVSIGSLPKRTLYIRELKFKAHVGYLHNFPSFPGKHYIFSTAHACSTAERAPQNQFDSNLYSDAMHVLCLLFALNALAVQNVWSGFRRIHYFFSASFSQKRFTFAFILSVFGS